MAERHAQPDAEQGPDRAERRGLAQDQREHLAAGRTLHAQQADQLPALHDGERQRVVDQEHADDQRQQAQRGQIQVEGARHLLQGVGTSAGAQDLGPRG